MLDSAVGCPAPGSTGRSVMSLVTEHLIGRGVAFQVIPIGGCSPRSSKPGNWG
jgi:hypothetical protein